MNAPGKHIVGKTYLHRCILGLHRDLAATVARAQAIANLSADDFNVIKVSDSGTQMSLLDYPTFFDEAFPPLTRYWTVDLDGGTAKHRTYAGSLNPPILHRKELLIPPEHPDWERFEALTSAAEQIGLFDDSVRIGFKQAWEALLVQKGYKVVGHDLVPIGNDESESSIDEISSFDRVERHRTALTRYGFSAPMQTLARFGLLDGAKTVFDYGCGRGDDLRNLAANNISASGWDPYYASDGVKQPADIVNLGFVINVIENLEERAEALRGAYSMANDVLVVSAMLASQQSVKGLPYGDGVLTGRNTFQKYYTQEGLRHYIADILQESPIPVGPGIFYVFKNKEAEQRFMYGRLENRRMLLRLAYLSRPRKPSRQDRALAKYEEHRTLLESLWQRCLEFGRTPDNDEITNLAEVKQHFGTVKAAARFIFSMKESADTYFHEAKRARMEVLTVYFAQLQFERKRPYRQLELRLQRDVRGFFGDYKSAIESARVLLFQLANPKVINEACADAATRGIGWYEDSQSLQLHTSMVPQLPPALRVYIACGTALYGDVSSADLIKIHIRSGKLTLMKFDDFENQPLPRMLERTKIKLREQDIDYYVYGDEYEPPFLYRKSRYINEEYPRYADQVAFDETLESLVDLNSVDFGPNPDDCLKRLRERRWKIENFDLVRSTEVPCLDDMCGANFTYRALIECGKTQSSSGINNRPKDVESYNALYDLATHILDPVIDYFGSIRLTYGFCSNELRRLVKTRVAPDLDQHAAHEVKRTGQPVCGRLGAAVDFYVEDEDMEEVAEWIISQLPFDRLYFYGKDRPLHVSYGPAHASAAYRMVSTSPHRIAPRPFERIGRHSA